MAFNLLDLLSPHYCIACGEIGDIICEHCKYDIIEDRYSACLVCGHQCALTTNLCLTCSTSYTKAWCVGERSASLQKLLDTYKFERAERAKHPLAALLDETIPVLPPDITVSYVTTISPHIRLRGHDHARSIAREFARMRKLPLERTLTRNTNKHQFGSSRTNRIKNASEAFRVCKNVSGKTILIIDDIMTTGATVEYASKCLLDAGARAVYIAVIARQRLEK